MGFFDGFFDPTYNVVHKGEHLTISGKRVLTIRNDLELVRTNSGELLLYGDLPNKLKRRSKLEEGDNTKLYKSIRDLMSDAHHIDMNKESVVRMIAEQLGIDFFYENLPVGEWYARSGKRDNSVREDEIFYGGRPNDVNNLYFDYTLGEDEYGLTYTNTYLNAYKKEEFKPDKYIYSLKDGNYFISDGHLLGDKGSVNPHLKNGFGSKSIIDSMFYDFNNNFYEILGKNNLKIEVNDFQYNKILELEKEAYSEKNVEKQKLAELAKKNIYISKK